MHWHLVSAQAKGVVLIGARFGGSHDPTEKKNNRKQEFENVFTESHSITHEKIKNHLENTFLMEAIAVFQILQSVGRTPGNGDGYS
jgi:hypothetical protein